MLYTNKNITLYYFCRVVFCNVFGKYYNNYRGEDILRKVCYALMLTYFASQNKTLCSIKRPLTCSISTLLSSFSFDTEQNDRLPSVEETGPLVQRWSY